MKRLSILFSLALCFAASGNMSAQERGSAALSQEVAGVGNTMRVLLIAAHPDDEDTQLISWLTHGQHVETAYLSLTRGDGGQNLIGNELGEALGVIRTAELMSARRIDGAQQYFTRAFDFGFSKDTADTFRQWPKDSLLRDAVRVVRDFAPHVIVAVFSGTPRDGHGQHQASAIIAKEVWTAAADTVRFPVSEYGPAWTPLKFYRSARFAPAEATLKMNVGEYNPVLGKSYFEIAAESRSQHKSQGFGTLQRKGVIWDYLRREESRVAAPADAKAEKSMFDGIDTTLDRFRTTRERPSCDEVNRNLDAVRGTVSLLASTPIGDRRLVVRRLTEIPSAILRIQSAASGSGAQSCAANNRDGARTLEVMQRRAFEALIAATDLEFEAVVNRPSAAIGDTFTVTNRIHNRGSLPVRVRGGQTGNGEEFVLLPDSSFEYKLVWNEARVNGQALKAPGTEPTWLRVPRNGALFGAQENPMDALIPGLEEITAVAMARVDSGMVTMRAPVTYHVADPVRGDMQLPFTIAPGISINFDRRVELARAGVARTRYFNVTVRSAFGAPRTVKVSLQLPRGLTADSVSREVTIGPNGVRTATFKVSGQLPAGEHEVRATATSEGKSYAVGYVPIQYEHIPPQRMYRPATVRISSVPVAVPSGLNIGYVRGVGDNLPATLQDLGLPVTTITPAELPSADLSRFSTIVVGTRAYQASQELIDNNSYLLEFVRRGGTLVSQYGQYEMTQAGVMPYPITLARPAERVTDELAEVRITDSGSPLLSFPNRITLADFTGWTQERASYMPGTFDSNYKSLLSMNDPGESPKNSAVLVTPYGKGLYIYTTLSFFRQLPAGNPGAARLLVNLLSARASGR